MRRWLLAALVAAGLAWACVPRPASLTAFDPDRTAERETAMWRAYYGRDALSLFADLYQANRVESGFSPLDSLLIALDAARAARAFQPTHSRAEAAVALPLLERYYARLAVAAPARFDPNAAAGLELDWWQARREAAPPAAYGRTIARVASLIYGRDNPEIAAYGALRAEAMADRDRRGAAIAEADWRAIAATLRRSYRALSAGLNEPIVAKGSP